MAKEDADFCRTMFENAQDACLVIDPETLLPLEFNDAACRTLGYARAEFARLTVADYQLDESAAELRGRIAEVLREGRTSFLTHLRTKSGERRTVLVTAHKVALNGKDAVASIRHDITELQLEIERGRLLTEALRQSESIVIITNAKGDIEYVNPRFTEVTGYSAAEALGRNPRFLKSGQTPEATYQALWETLGAGKVWRGEIQNRRKEGSFYHASLTISPVKDADGRIVRYLGIQEDVTERRSLEAQLLQAQKLESLGRLAGGVAHDFNNLLTALTGYSEIALAALPKDSPARADLKEILATIRRATALTKQLLLFSRRQPARMAPVELNGVLVGMNKLLRRVIGESVELSVLLCDGEAWANADVGQLEQVVLNLAINARDAMPRGGTLRLATEKVRLDGAAAPGGLPSGDYVRLRVCDDGIGMPPEVLARVFEPFFTTKGPGKGTGLGLSTCFGIVKKFGGAIDVASAVGRGSAFDVLLPATERASSPAHAETPDPLELRGRERVLVAEDDAGLRSVMKRILTDHGYQAALAADGHEALNLLDSGAPFDLLLTDVVMPGLGGRQLAREARRRRPALKVLFVSGYLDESSVHSPELGAEDPLLLKPFAQAELLRQVRLALDSTPGPAR